MLIDMASKVQFQIYYGEKGHIEFGPKGINFRRFGILISMIDKPEEWTIQSVY
jgi:hypothetical protein